MPRTALGLSWKPCDPCERLSFQPSTTRRTCDGRGMGAAGCVVYGRGHQSDTGAARGLGRATTTDSFLREHAAHSCGFGYGGGKECWGTGTHLVSNTGAMENMFQNGLPSLR
jgi:hypothetical protein